MVTSRAIRLTAGIHDHQRPSVHVVHDRLKALPSGHSSVRLRTVRAVHARLRDGLLARGEERGREWEGREEQQDDDGHDECRDSFDLRGEERVRVSGH